MKKVSEFGCRKIGNDSSDTLNCYFDFYYFCDFACSLKVIDKEININVMSYVLFEKKNNWEKKCDKYTVWSPVTDHYVNKVNFFRVNSKCQDCFYVVDKGIISSND